MTKLPRDPIIGYKALAEALGTSHASIKQCAYRGTLGLTPIDRIGRLPVFDGKAVRTLARKQRRR